MPKSITVEKAQSELKRLIDQMAPGEELVITDRERPVAKLINQRPTRHTRPAPGLGKRSMLYRAFDFDALFEEFRKYMG
jgi:antitoxin (DNA-binding transcriptional repressor) of toxin-antitoxin stability system